MEAKERILVVDDEGSIGNVVAGILNRNRFEATFVCSRAEAQTQLERQDFDLVISDATMRHDREATEEIPSGVLLLDWARKNKPNARRILMSGGSKPISIPDETAFLKKPMWSNDLLELVRKLLES